METKTSTSQESKDFLTRQIESQRKELEESEQALQRYKEKYGIVQISQSPGQKESEDVSMQRLTGLTSNLIQAQTVRMESESRYKEVKDLLDKGASYESIPQISNSNLIQQLRVQEAQLDAQLSEASQKYGEKHPKMTQLRKEIEGVRLKIKTEAQQVILSLKNEYSIAKAKEDAAQRAVQAQKGETQKLSERSIEYGVLLREVEKNRELYENLLKKMKETSVETELGTTNISVIDPAEVPRVPFKPRKTQNVGLSIIVGLFCAVGLAFFLEYLDNTVKTPEDIEKYMETPCIALIPSIDFEKEVGKGVPHPEIIVHHKPKSTTAEAFRSLRTAVLFSYPANTTRSLLVTSCVPKEGKTFIAANLALVMAYSGESVLLIDADMRKPQVHAIFELANEKGLSNAIVGDEPMIHRSVLHEKLDVLTSGPIAPNPAELLGSAHMTELLESLQGKYQNIILDSPPLASVTDGVVLARLVGGTMHVVHGGSTTRDMARHGASQLAEVDARSIGSVLNNIDIAKENYYYSHYYHYYHYNNDYYAEDGEKKTAKGRRRRDA
jgi:capsular exopolysaccharide synthesis family protein